MAPQAFDRSALLPYLPRLLVHWLADDPIDLARAGRDVVFVDISGFTKLSEKLAKSGRMGAEELAEAIGSCFARLLAIAYGNGGGLLKFGGDALLLFFTGTDHALKGARAAAGMRRDAPRDRQARDLGRRVQLGCSVGLQSGVFHLFLVGGSHREFIDHGAGGDADGCDGGGGRGRRDPREPRRPRRCLPPRSSATRGPGFLLRGGFGGLTARAVSRSPAAPGELIVRRASREASRGTCGRGRAPPSTAGSWWVHRLRRDRTG